MSIPDRYKQWLDQQTIDFIDRTVAFYPTDTITATIAEQREIYDAMCRQFSAEPPAQVAWQDVAMGAPRAALEVRCYSCGPLNKVSATLQGRADNADGPSDAAPVIVYLHGGGFVVGGLESHHDVCAEFCEQSGFELVSVDYRLSPEHTHPAALDDVLAVVRQVTQAGSSVILCGDSAGGNLAAAASAVCRDDASLCGAVLGQLLIYPGLGGDLLPQVVAEVAAMGSGALGAGEFADGASSYVNHRHAPMLTLQEVHFYAEVRVPPGGLDKMSTSQLVSMAPLLDDHFERLPPTVCFGAQCDPLHDDGKLYCKAINEAGGKARFISEPGMVHGYLRARNTVERASASFGRMVEVLKQFGQA